MLQNSYPWRSLLKNQYQQEIKELKQLPLRPTNAPILIGTAAGYFEIAWNCDKTVLMVWITGNTWESILKKIVRVNSLTNCPYVDNNQKNVFLSQTEQRQTTQDGVKPFLRAYPSSLLNKIFRRVRPWNDELIQNFGSWVELSCLLPSYILWQFAPQLQAASNRGVQGLKYVQEYATVARNFLKQRGQLVGFDVGESGLWLGSSPIYLQNRNFNLIWGLGGRSDFAIRARANDGSVEYWDLKTRSFGSPVNSIDELIAGNDLQQVTRQAPMQLIYASKGKLPIPNVMPVKTIGIISVGCDLNGQVISHSQTVNLPTQEVTLFGRAINTIRTAQWYEQLGNLQRVELAVDILGEVVNRLISALIDSDEWGAIQQELDGYWQRKYHCF